MSTKRGREKARECSVREGETFIMGACCCKKRPNIAAGRSQTVVLAVELRYPCKSRARKLTTAAEKCRGVQHVAFDRGTGLLTVVGMALDPSEIQYWVERKACGRATVISKPPPAAAEQLAPTSGAPPAGSGGGGSGSGGGQSGGMLWDGPVEHRCWAVPPCIPPCATPHYGYYCPFSRPFP